jgi:predicted ATP-dependent serine protease
MNNQFDQVANATQQNGIVDASIVKRKKVEVKSFKEMAVEGESLPELKKLFGNHILEGNTVLFPAERGIGKTFLSLELAIVIAEGEDSFIGEPIELNGNTLYINMELGERIMMKRLSTLYKGFVKKKESQYQAYCITGRKCFAEIEFDVESWVKQYNPVLVVVDNLRTAFSESDNERNKEMTRAITKLNTLRDKYGFSLLLVHHTKKGTSSLATNSDLQSGAGAITDLVDGDFFMRKSQNGTDLRLLKRAKSRNCEEQDGSKLIRLNPETLWFELIEESVDEMDHIFFPGSLDAKDAELKQTAVLLRNEGKTFEEIGLALGKNKSTISRWFK